MLSCFDNWVLIVTSHIFSWKWWEYWKFNVSVVGALVGGLDKVYAEVSLSIVIVFSNKHSKLIDSPTFNVGVSYMAYWLFGVPYMVDQKIMCY